MAGRTLALLAFVGACGSRNPTAGDAAIDAGYMPDACEGIGCFQVDCSTKGLLPTTVSGTVYAPNGTLPLYGVDVYVPRSDPGPLAAGVQCSRCDQGLQGGSYAQTRTDEAGRFKLENVPATSNVPVVIQIGKWRRQLTLENVAACEELPLPAAQTRLPRDSSEGDLPQIAISTGLADSLECFIRKLGIADTEIKTRGQGGRVHLYADNGVAGEGANKFATGFAGGTGNFAGSTTLWNSVDELKAYDIVIFSCEGGHYNATKSQAAMNAVKAYADLGGRVFLSHWHNIWIEGAAYSGGTQAPPVWTSIATWNHAPDLPNPTIDTIDELANPKGMSFASWMLEVGGSTVRGQIPVTQAQQTCNTVDNAKAERWVYWTNGTVERTQNFQFTTPNEVVAEQRCGKVVFSDMHVSAGSTSAPATPYPNGCSNTPLTPQEKALAFMFFDIASCVGSIF